MRRETPGRVFVCFIRLEWADINGTSLFFCLHYSTDAPICQEARDATRPVKIAEAVDFLFFM
jgi:hypothetical protein